jgi:hypothetical protein
MNNQETNARGWPLAHFSHSSGQSECGVELFVQIGRPLTDTDNYIIGRAMRAIEKELMAESTRSHPDNIAWKARWLSEARSMFAVAGLAPIYVREIDNEYCGPKCCPHRVWLLVTTRVGVIKVGWRKSV